MAYVPSFRYVIGLDFGSLSCRGVLTDTGNGNVEAESEFTYPHGVISTVLPGGADIPKMWALQDPGDYLKALSSVVRALLEESGAPPEAVVAIGLDTTASTVLPVDAGLAPLCRVPRFAGHPHAWPKMWKHHASEAEARAITNACGKFDPKRTETCGGAVGAEFYLPKVIQVWREDREVFDAAETFMELGDWLISLMAGREIRSGAYLSCKALWDRARGYPGDDVFGCISPELCALPQRKLAYHGGASPVIAWPGEAAGTLSEEYARRLGLTDRTVVTAAQMDAYAGLPGCGISNAGTLMMMIGTSTGYMLLGNEEKPVPGICAMVRNSILPGYVCYAAGQAGVGDIFQWFTDNCVPGEYLRESEKRGLGIHEYLSALAEAPEPGESGLLALDWWNGNKSCLNDPRLSGMVLGMDLRTRPEEIYRALLEATAFGARKIVENFQMNGVAVDDLIACGGISLKNPLLMQIYTDVLGKPIRVAADTQTAATGSAIYAAAAAGRAAGGWESVADAVKAMAGREFYTYRPRMENHGTYDELYGEYMTLHEYFGGGGNRVMERLKKRRAAVHAGAEGSGIR